MKFERFVNAVFWAWTEIKIILSYAVFPAIMINILGLGNWDTDMVIGLIKFFVFIHITYHEDMQTLTQNWSVLLARFLAMGVSLYILPYVIQYWTINGVQVTGHEGGKPYWSWNSSPNSNWFNYEKCVLFASKLVTEYLKFVMSLANYRLVFVGVAFLIFVFMQLMLMWATGNEDDPTDD